MSHPRYIQVYGNWYRLVRAAREAPVSFNTALSALVHVYDHLIAEADPVPALHKLLDILKFVRSAAVNVEKTLPDPLRHGTGMAARWSLHDMFSDALQQLDKTYKKLHRAMKETDRRQALHKFAQKRGLRTPDARRVPVEDVEKLFYSRRNR
jgi:hypothetical protein